MESDQEAMFGDDEDTYFEDDDAYYEEEDDYEGDSKLDTNDVTVKSYRVVQEADFREFLDNRVQEISSTLSLSKDEAIKLLHHYRWKESKLHDEWFSDEERVRAKVGLPSRHNHFSCTKQLTTCGICFWSFPLDHDHFYPTFCGHTYCVTCWKEYLSISIKDGPGCLSLKCPEPKCRTSVVDRGMIDKLASDEERGKYYRYLFRSYVEVNNKMKWCPAPGCENAVEYEVGSEVFNVTCLCSHAFCWNCVEEVHSPVGCATVADWILKNGEESRNTAWVTANSKACPECKRSIEKNHGCMHMRCPEPCLHEFCWLCLGAWSSHNRAKGYSSCNVYKAAKKTAAKSGVKYNEMEMAKINLQRYTHYYHRWTSNHKSRQKAIDDFHKLQAEFDNLSDRLKATRSELVFTLNAWEQVIECRRVLKWTYAYGYYLPEHSDAERTFFEYLQGEAEAGLERLHQCVEQELSVFLEQTVTTDQEKLEADFKAFRPKLIDLTIVTRSYFEKLVRALETKLSEVAERLTTLSLCSCCPPGEDCQKRAGQVNKGWSILQPKRKKGRSRKS